MAEDPSIDVDRQARFNDLFDRHYAAVRAYVARRSGTLGIVDDALSEIFLVAWRRIDLVSADGLPWLLGFPTPSRTPSPVRSWSQSPRR